MFTVNELKNNNNDIQYINKNGNMDIYIIYILIKNKKYINKKCVCVSIC